MSLAVNLLERAGVTQATLAAELGLSRTVVNRWWAGRAKPPAPRRAAIADRWPAITFDSWDQPAPAVAPAGAPLVPSAASLVNTPVWPPVAPAVEAPAPVDLSGPDAIEVQLEEQVNRLLDDLATARNRRAPAAHIARFESELRKALESLNAVRDRAPLTAADLLQEPAFKVALDAIAEALGPWPDARRALLKVLSALQS